MSEPELHQPGPGQLAGTSGEPYPVQETAQLQHRHAVVQNGRFGIDFAVWVGQAGQAGGEVGGQPRAGQVVQTKSAAGGVAEHELHRQRLSDDGRGH
jgi:hypothetical protein